MHVKDVKNQYIYLILIAGFTYRFDRLKPRRAKVYNIFNTVIWLSHLCCHNVLYFLNSPSVILPTQLHSISENCRILNTPHHHWLHWSWLNTLPSSSSREGGELGGTSQVDKTRASIYLNPALLIPMHSKHGNRPRQRTLFT